MRSSRGSQDWSSGCDSIELSSTCICVPIPEVPCFQRIGVLAVMLLAHLEQSRARVISNFAEVGRVDLACEMAGVGRTTHYGWLKSDPEYKAAFDAAREQAIDLLEDKARERALAGESDRLLEFLLKGLKPEVYGDRMKTEISGQLEVTLGIAETLRQKREERLKQIEGGE